MKPAPLAPVIVGVDGSASSMSAVRAAAGLASLYGLPLQVVHAFNWLPRWPEGTDAQGGRAVKDLVHEALTAADDVSPRLRVTTRLLEGSPSATLLRQARTAAILAVGDGGLAAHVCLPTHASAVRVAARAPCSVLVARAEPPSDGPVVVGVDGSAASEQALDFAFDIAALSGVDLVVVRAGTSAVEADAALVDLVAVREDKYGVAARIRVAPGDPAEALVAESQQARLLVVGARGERTQGGLLGSAAQSVLHHGRAAVVLVRALLPHRAGSTR